MSNTLLAKLKKNSKITGTATLSESQIFGKKDAILTDVPMLNVALSGNFDSGISAGSTVLAGPSKHFKTAFSLVLASAFLKKYDDGVILFYDSEFGSPQQYFKNFGVDPTRVVHTPIMNIEEFKFDLIAQLEALTEDDHVMIIADSVGNLASKKELEDAKAQKSVADMTRAKALKGLYRMVTPYLNLKNIPMVSIAHIYMTQEMYSKAIVAGGTGITYSANSVFIVGRQQDKLGTELQGYHFIINVDKSRFVKEKSKIPISVTFNGGVEKYSGLLELAMAGGYVIKPKMGWYQKVDPQTKQPIPGSYREADTYTAEFWDLYLNSEIFKEFVKVHYTVGYRSLIEGEFLADVKIDVVTKDPDDENSD